MDRVLDLIESRREEIISLLQQFVQIPSPTCQEGRMADFFERSLREMGLKTFSNPLGDVTGVCQGEAEDQKVFLLNTHLDQAEAGDMEDAYSGSIVNGAKFGVNGQVVFGRGTDGQKACLAAMVSAAKAILDVKTPLKRGFAINAGVMEECGGHLSPQYLIEKDQLPIFAVLSGEHTDLKPVNGHRGMLHLYLRVEGKGAHAAAPEGSSSALTGLARVILALEQLGAKLPKDTCHGDALVSLNKLSVTPNVVNAIPDRCDGVVDIRYPACVSKDDIVATIKECIGGAVAQQKGLTFTVDIRKQSIRSYTGYEANSDESMLPFYTPVDDPLVNTLQDCIQDVTGNRPEPELWKISSETGYFSTVAGLPVVAFGPGEDRFAHTRFEHVKVNDVIITTKVYASMILKLCV